MSESHGTAHQRSWHIRFSLDRQMFGFCFLVFTGFFFPLSTTAQVDSVNSVFGKGIKFQAKDSSFSIKFSFRVQPNYTGVLMNGPAEEPSTYRDNWSIRRSRLKLDGWVFSPKLVYKFEYDLVAGSIRDAVLKWNFAGAFHLWFGQAKLAGNLQRVTSSQKMQLVDRSLMNDRFNIDRDIGVQLYHSFLIGKAPVNWVVSYSQGDGINYRGSSTGGDITARVEAFPFGSFTKSGEEYEADLVREPRPKLLVGVSVDRNMNAFQDRGQWGDAVGFERDLQALFIDALLKWKGASILVEHSRKEAVNGQPAVRDSAGVITASFITGHGQNFQAGYVFGKDWEVAGRYSTFVPESATGRSEMTESTLGISRYFVGNALKVQLDASLLTTQNAPDTYRGRLQVELAF